MGRKRNGQVLLGQSARKHTSLGLAAGAMVLATGIDAQAQLCGIPKTTTKSKVKINLDRAFPDCTVPDTTWNGQPACTSGFVPVPGSYAVQDVKPYKTAGKLQLKSNKDGDVNVALTIQGAADAASSNNANGAITLRLTATYMVEEPPGNMLTTQPITVTAGGTLTEGKGAIKTTLNAMLANSALGALPPCFRIDIKGIEVVDGGNNQYLGGASTGTDPLFSQRSGIAFGTKG